MDKDKREWVYLYRDGDEFNVSTVPPVWDNETWKNPNNLKERCVNVGMRTVEISWSGADWFPEGLPK